MQRFWIFQTNPERFRIFDWWNDIRSKMDFWLANKGYRNEIRKWKMHAIRVAMTDQKDIWAIDKKYHDEIKNRGINAVLAIERYGYWEAKQFTYDIHKGDMTAIWVARGGSKDDIRGIYAIAEVITNPYETAPPRERGFGNYLRGENGQQVLEVGIRYAKEFFDKPISITSIRNHPILKGISILNFARGTNFQVNATEWNAIVELAHTRERI